VQVSSFGNYLAEEAFKNTFVQQSPFPKKVKITQNRIGWSAYEIHQWIENKLVSSE